jgi:hypothetical protein
LKLAAHMKLNVPVPAVDKLTVTEVELFVLHQVSEGSETGSNCGTT